MKFRLDSTSFLLAAFVRDALPSPFSIQNGPSISPANLGPAAAAKSREQILSAAHASLDWLRRAQDRSSSKDGGVAHNYSPTKGWSSSYPETTGYILETFIHCADHFRDEDLRERAIRMADWLLSIQFANGAFQGGLVDSTPRVPVVFNTGQILIGLSAAAEKFAGDYHGSMMRAAHWLCDVQDPSGGWSTHCSPFARPGSKTFDTHASIGLLSAARVSGESRFAEAALRNLRWATSHATRNGFIRSCCLDTPRAPYTHTLGYYLRGVVEGAYHFQDDSLLQSALLTARALQRCVQADGRLPGRLTHRLRPGAPWVCLTGSAQIAHSFFLLSKHDSSLVAHGRALNEFVLQTIARGTDSSADPNIVGAVAGSDPFDGGYCQSSYPNWATKFFIDSMLSELANSNEAQTQDPRDQS